MDFSIHDFSATEDGCFECPELDAQLDPGDEAFVRELRLEVKAGDKAVVTLLFQKQSDIDTMHLTSDEIPLYRAIFEVENMTLLAELSHLFNMSPANVLEELQDDPLPKEPTKEDSLSWFRKMMNG